MDMDKNEQAKIRLEAIEFNAKNIIAEHKVLIRDDGWYNRNAVVPVAPINIATSVDIGTDRARANHVDCAINYCQEQERLRIKRRPL